MKNSNELCLPLCLPFLCCEIDTGSTPFPPKPVMHYYAEIIYMREGRIRVLLNQEEYNISSGEVMLCCPGVSHWVDTNPEAPARLDLIRVDPERLAEAPAYAPDLKAILADACRENMPMHFSVEEAREMHLPEICEACKRETKKQNYGYDLTVRSGLSQLFMQLIRFWIARGLIIGSGEPQMEPIYTLSGYIQKHLQDGLKVEDLAARCGLSYPWFAKKFREIYGISCKDYIEQIRVARVEHYLLFTNLDLNRISEVAGYADCSHMIKNFKRIMGTTPGQYRLKRR